MILNKVQFANIFPNSPSGVYETLSAQMNKYFINNNAREAHFLAQAGYESVEFRYTQEFMSYSAPRLVAVFPSKFKDLSAATPYAQNPQKTANFVYANKYGNGNECTGDGYKYRGHSYLQITFKDNFKEVSKLVGEDFVMHPEKLAKPYYSAIATCAWWVGKGLNKLAEGGPYNLNKITKIINGASMAGLLPRKRIFDKIWNIYYPNDDKDMTKVEKSENAHKNALDLPEIRA